MKKSSKIIMVLLIVLIIAILGIGVYFMTNLNGKEDKNNDTSIVNNNSSNSAKVTNSSGSNIENENSDKKVTTTEEYTQEELEQMALDYYEKTTGYRPGNVASEIGSDGKLQIQLYDNLGDHNSTLDWYTIDMKTGKDQNISGEEIDLTNEE